MEYEQEISIDQFQDWLAVKNGVRPIVTEKILLFLKSNQGKAFTMERLSKEIYNSDDDKAVKRTMALLYKMLKKNLVLHKAPYWAYRKPNGIG
jgi:hypothetical protein